MVVTQLLPAVELNPTLDVLGASTPVDARTRVKLLAGDPEAASRRFSSWPGSGRRMSFGRRATGEHRRP
jgi:hypothetical protein